MSGTGERENHKREVAIVAFNDWLGLVDNLAFHEKCDRPRNALIVEGDLRYSRTVVSMLERMGWNAYETCNPDVACMFAKHSDCPIDLILWGKTNERADNGMSLDRIRRQFPAVPVMFMVRED